MLTKTSHACVMLTEYNTPNEAMPKIVPFTRRGADMPQMRQLSFMWMSYSNEAALILMIDAT